MNKRGLNHTQQPRRGKQMQTLKMRLHAIVLLEKLAVNLWRIHIYRSMAREDIPPTIFHFWFSPRRRLDSLFSQNSIRNTIAFATSHTSIMLTHCIRTTEMHKMSCYTRFSPAIENPNIPFGQHLGNDFESVSMFSSISFSWKIENFTNSNSRIFI